ncbi:hypothetical protein AB0G06_43605 [Nonomuraea dietziae]|uniref:hypothetical protein n=1 Tax=Nonomuraea dietziae TaxID=65515 RepID=UPI0033C8EE01
MHQIKDRMTGVELRRTLTVYDYDNGTVEFTAKVVGHGVEACAAVAANPEELSQLIDHLIHVYNGYVDSGIADTTKYRLD